MRFTPHRSKPAAVLIILAIVLSSSQLACANHTAPQPFERTLLIKAPAVSADGSRGSLIDVAVTVKYPGSGQVFVSVSTLSEVDVQASARMAALVACKVLGVDPFSYDFYISVASPTMIVGGPSAGAAMTLAAMAGILGLNLSSSVVMTGMIEPDGFIGPVGGIVAKAEAAAKAGAQVFLIPLGQEITYVERVEEVKVGPFVTYRAVREPVNITEYALKNWGLRVLEVGDVYEATQYLLMNGTAPVKILLEEPVANLTLPAEVANVFKQGQEQMVSEQGNLVKRALTEVQGLKPSEREEILKLLNASDYHVKQAMERSERGLVYIAASEAFASAWTAEEALALARLSKAENADALVRQMVDEINASAQRIRQRLDSYAPRTLSDVDCLATCYDRLSSASDAINDAAKSYGEGDLAKTAYYLSYAKWRVKTAELWFNALGLGRAEAPSEARLRSIASALLAEARSVASYANALATEVGVGQVSLLSSALDDLKQAEDFYARDVVYAAISKSISSVAKASTAINQIFTGSQELLEHQLNYSERLARKSIGNLLNSGVLPITSLSYYEYASYGLENPLDKLLHYRLASAYAGALALAGAVSEHPELVSPSAVGEELPSKQALPLWISATAILLLVMGFAAGFFMGRSTKREEGRPQLQSFCHEVLLYASA